MRKLNLLIISLFLVFFQTLAFAQTFNESGKINTLEKHSESKDEVVKIEEMLFDISGEAVTSYDFKIFKEAFVATDQLLPSKILTHMSSSEDRFLILKLAAKESEQLGLEYDQNQFDHVVQKDKVSHVKKNEIIEGEIKQQMKAIALLQIKDKQFQDKSSILAWMQVLKRKYLMNVKSEDFKNKLSFRI